jgi:hypothetical protein
LLVCPEQDHQPVQQEEWQVLLGQVHEEPHVEDGEGDYRDEALLNMYEAYDWQEDLQTLRLTSEDLKSLPGWIKEKKSSEQHDEEAVVAGGLPEDLNEKQKLAYTIVCKYIDGIIEDKGNGTTNTTKLLLNISGAAGTICDK